MKQWLWLALFLAIGSLTAGRALAADTAEFEPESGAYSEAEKESVMAEEPKAIAAVEPKAAKAVEPYDENFAIGACIGKGAGLAGVYTYFRPTDLFAIEADFGARMFIYANSAGEVIDVYWPAAAALKAQFYFMNRQKRFQPGVEAGVLYAEDTGAGGEVSGIMTLRLNRHLHLDANFGAAVFPEMDNKQLDYIVSQRGGRRSSYNLTSTGGFALMWGVGMSVVF